MDKTEVMPFIIKKSLSFKSLHPHTGGFYDDFYILQIQMESFEFYSLT